MDNKDLKKKLSLFLRNPEVAKFIESSNSSNSMMEMFKLMFEHIKETDDKNKKYIEEKIQDLIPDIYKEVKEQVLPDFLNEVKGEFSSDFNEFKDLLKKELTEIVTPKRGIDYFTDEEASAFLAESTPIKGIDYFDGKPGKPGKDGYTPIKGLDYFDGKDGSPDTPNEIAEKLNTLEEAVNVKVIKGYKDILRKEVKTIIKRGGSSGSSSGGHTIEDEGTPLTQRDTINFVGAGVTVTDSGSKTVVTIPGGGTGDVTAASTLTDNAIVRGDGGVKGVQTSGVTISDTDVVSGITQLNVDNLRLDGNTISSTDVNGDINFTPNGTGRVAVLDTQFILKDDGDPTKIARFNASGIGAGVTRTFSFPNLNGTLALNGGGSANQIAYFDSADSIASLDTSTYPSLTELSYFKGVTSAIQTQINTKANSSGALTQFVGNGNWKVWYSDGSGDVQELALGADGTFLKSNGASSAPSFATPAGSGDVSKVGTPVNNQIGVWTGDGTIEGDPNLTFDGDTLLVQNDTDSASVQVAIFEGDRATFGSNDEAYITLRLSDNAGTQTEFGRLTWVATDVGDTTEDGRIDFDAIYSGSLSTGMSVYGWGVDIPTGYISSTGTTPYFDLYETDAAKFGGIYMSGGNLNLYADSPGTIRLNNTLNLNANYISGPLVPLTNDAWDIGSATNAWAGLYLGPAEVIHFENKEYIYQGSAADDNLYLTAPSGYTVNIANTFAGVSAKLDVASIATSDKTFTFQNKTGSIALIESNTTLSSIGNNDLILQTGNATTGTITITDGVNGNIDLNPNGTGNVLIGNYTFDGDQSVGAGQDNYVLTYDNGTGLISLEAASGGGANTALSNLAAVAINTTLVSDTDNTDALGTAAIGWSDLFLGNGAVITFSSAPSTADVTITHSADTLTIAGGDLVVPDEAYGVGWNGSNEVPTKNAIYDKIETMGGGVSESLAIAYACAL